MLQAKAYPTASHQKKWGQVTGMTQAPMLAADDPYVLPFPGGRVEVGSGGSVYETLGAVVDHAPRGRGGVSTLMHVGDDGLGQLGPDLSATSRTVGWGGTAVWAYAKFIKKDKDLAEKAMYVAIGGWVGSFLL
jgi:hypothetical protein